MSKLTAPSSVAPFGIQDYKTQAEFENVGAQLGAEFQTTTGQTVQIAKAGATTLVAGTLLQGPARKANVVNLAFANTSLVIPGAKTVTITVGDETVTANEYAGGFIVGSNGAGKGVMTEILSHPAWSAAGNVTFTVVDTIAFSANSVSRVDLVPHDLNGVVIAPTTPTGPIVGVAASNTPNAQYGFVYSLKAGSKAAVLIEGTPAVDQPVTRSANVAGALAVAYTANSTVVTAFSNSAPVGRMTQTGVDGKLKVVQFT